MASTASLRNTPLPKGVYVPTPTFFDENSDLDLKAHEEHLRTLIPTGIAGVILLGSTGEAVHLTEAERSAVFRSSVGYLRAHAPGLKILAGCGAQGIRPTMALIEGAARAGAEYALVLPPSYYRAQIGMAEVKAWFLSLAEQSPLPIVIYNYPMVSQGVDIDGETLIELSRHPNIVGVKGTDGNVGKSGYVASKVDRRDFAVLAGSADFFLSALTVGAVGCVVGLGNLCPRAVVEVQRLFDEGRLDEARKVQLALIQSDNAMNRWYGLPGGKAVLQELRGYGGGYVRLPLLKIEGEKLQRCLEGVKEGWALEQRLQ